jgi:hypothetical protein
MHPPGREDDLSACERRLAGWQPAAGNLDTDAMLFAAGRAAGRRGRLLWPALCTLLAAQVAGLGVWGFSERSERVALAGLLHDRVPAPNIPQAPAVAEFPEPRYSPSPDDYFHLRRRLEQDPGRWLAAAQTAGTKPIGPPLARPPILKAGQLDGLLPQ